MTMNEVFKNKSQPKNRKHSTFVTQGACRLEIEAGCSETFTCQHHYVVKPRKKKKVSLEFTADPFRAEAITPAVGLRKSQLGPEAS